MVGDKRRATSPTRADRLRAGVALFNAGHYLPAHEPWERSWLTDPRGRRDDCLQGLVQTTAAVHHARDGNVEGAVGLAETAIEYLSGCPPTVEAPIEWLEALLGGTVSGAPPPIRLGGEAIEPADLTYPAVAIAAEALAEHRGDEFVEDAVAYATADLAKGDATTPFVTLVRDYLVDGDGIVARRLTEHVQRRRARETDVEGLFE